MTATPNAAPVLIKRKKVVGGDGHHGGAWKVAYADFVTAMMAFFLLMWLLNATSEDARQGLAAYFSPSVPISRASGGGDGAFEGSSTFSEDSMSPDGIGAAQRDLAETNEASSDQNQEQEVAGDDKELKELDSELRGNSGESLISDSMLKHIVTRVTDKGLIIELYATDQQALFQEGTAQPTQLLRQIVGMVARVSGKVTNGIEIAGYMRSYPVVVAKAPVWELSTDRAGAVRQLLESSGIQQSRIRRVVGHADREPALPDEPMAARNNRIEITLLRKQ
ncbi:OmpA/MotB family protein [Chachezhania sediminis]|uniref:OmpA/MotB family protein n=1 Tax=Chachezhania sediminis TaxID=2599291 RepID=UPI00131D3460|nr:flagellar motor protein MotB [Chachezhania sediminis]